MKLKATTYLLLLGCISSCIPTQAQERKRIENVLQWEAEQLIGTWRHSGNPAGLSLDVPGDVSRLEAGYTNRSGNYRRPQDDLSSTSLWTKANGNTRLNKLYVQGYFDYERDDKKDVAFNASLIDPFRPMPYILADTNASDWINQHYRLGFDIAAPWKNEKLYTGVSVRYEASSGAKQRDMRARNSHYAIELRPGLIYQIDSRHRIGAYLLYRNQKEESVNSNVNVYVEQPYFMLYGLGHAVEKRRFDNLAVTYTANYSGDRWGGDIQYQYAGPWYTIMTAGYQIGAEDVVATFTNPRPEGTLLQRVWQAKLRTQRTGARLSHVIEANAQSSSADGIEYLNEFITGIESDGYHTRYKGVRSTYRTSTFTGRYDLVKHNGNGYDWKVRAQLEYRRQNDRYLAPQSYFNLRHLTYSAQWDKSFAVDPRRPAFLAVGAHVSYSQNLQGDYLYGGFFAESLPVTGLMMGDLSFLSSNQLRFGIPITYSRALGDAKRTTLFVKASGYYTKPTAQEFNSRSVFSFSVGSTF